MEQQELRPEPVFLWKMIIETFLLIAVIALPAAVMGYFIGLDEGGVRGAMLGWGIPMAVGAAVFVLALPFLPFYYRSLRYVIHRDEAVVQVGVVTKSVKHVPYRTVTNIKVARGPFDRLFGIGTLKIQTAGMSGQTGAEESLVGLRNVGQVYEQVAARLRQFRGAMAATAGSEDEPALDGDLGAILQEIRSIRRLMEER
jgi:membrane protein YdbS with pleckstrin-like domain